MRILLVPVEIKKLLDLLNLDGEKLIIYKPITLGFFNRTLYVGYFSKILRITRWCIYQ
jgi:hypothetical protein